MNLIRHALFVLMVPFFNGKAADPIGDYYYNYWFKSKVDAVSIDKTASIILQAQKIKFPKNNLMKLVPKLQIKDNPELIQKFEAANALYISGTLYMANPDKIANWGRTYHELWHAYRSLILNPKENEVFTTLAKKYYGKFTEKFNLYDFLVQSTADLIYSDYEKQILHKIIADEAVGYYIEDMMTVLVFLDKKTKKNPPVALTEKDLNMLLTAISGAQTFGQGYNSQTKEEIRTDFPIPSEFKKYGMDFLENYPVAFVEKHFQHLSTPEKPLTQKWLLENIVLK